MEENISPVILTVDDNLLNLATVNSILKKKNYNVLTTDKGKQAIEIAEKNKVDLILLDIQMPEISGFEVCEILKKNIKTADIPIIFLTAQEEIEDLVNGFRVGAVDYIIKPFNDQELYARVATHLELKFSREKIENQKKELEKLSIVASHTDNSVVIISKYGDIEWVNDGFIKMFGYTKEEYISLNGENIFQSNINQEISNTFIKCINEKQSTNYITETQNKKGENICVQTTLTPIIDENGNVQKLVAIDSDITKLKEAEILIKKEQAKSEALLLNILPIHTANELKEKGKSTPRYYSKASVLFADFVGFTKISEKLSPVELVEKLDLYFIKFDEIINKFDLEKIKTIGDSYMCASGISVEDEKHTLKIVLAALEMQKFVESEAYSDKIQNKDPWLIRIGIHTGELVAGVVGKKKFAYDIWGDTVNIASRMESSGEEGKVNISEATYLMVKDLFSFSYRGMIDAKNKGQIKMYFVESLKPEYYNLLK